MDINWTAATEPDLHHYNIYRGTQPNFTLNLTQPDFNTQTNSYSDSPVITGTTYYYRIAAVNTVGLTGQMSVESSAVAL
jgi:fibronectin type 3 domain-containing protein